MPKKFAAFLPDGTMVTRKTERDYRYVVAILHQGRWSQWGWRTERKAADTLCRMAVNTFHFDDAKVVDAHLQSMTHHRQAAATKQQRMKIDRCKQCGAPCSRHYDLCQHCREGK